MGVDSIPEESLTRIVQSPCFLLHTVELGSGLRVVGPVLWSPFSDSFIGGLDLLF